MIAADGHGNRGVAECGGLGVGHREVEEVDRGGLAVFAVALDVAFGNRGHPLLAQAQIEVVVNTA